jgi:hypothetical protein
MKLHKRRYMAPLAAFGLLLLGACATTYSSNENVIQKYKCADGSILPVRFNDNVATVQFSDNSLSDLTRKESEEELLYNNRRYELRGNYNEVIWVAGRKAPVTCHAIK